MNNHIFVWAVLGWADLPPGGGGTNRAAHAGGAGRGGAGDFHRAQDGGLPAGPRPLAHAGGGRLGTQSESGQRQQ
jgi:hypothetical protein